MGDKIGPRQSSQTNPGKQASQLFINITQRLTN